MLIRTSYVWSVGFMITIALFPFAIAGFLIGLPFGLSGNFVHAIGSFWAGIIVSLSGLPGLGSGDVKVSDGHAARSVS